uniref:Uncharacterized protein n=1 Tax=Lactuca sativa TaxID=4236 RepID=A0A9R1W684_LACSA|nr:hypothetical protein LSAT_V11C300153780 [Lactuca sativa]
MMRKLIVSVKEEGQNFMNALHWASVVKDIQASVNRLKANSIHKDFMIGVWPESPGFSDSDMPPVPPEWNGIFQSGEAFIATNCNRHHLTATENEKLKQLLESDDFYRIRLPSNVLHPSGKECVISSMKAVSLKPRCLPKGSLDEHIIIRPFNRFIGDIDVVKGKTVKTGFSMKHEIQNHT